ncbi:sulfite exporter TauE/SafE family protein [uncultured Flavobacterium sp.]|uniref:sulfite exporter TauE/SafE family protein n=1 Tax=uncultured Flavobacterium sp. TaxID=165435 RepID=UPI0030EE0759|tara:strand:- start:352994 stop:353749 length:756 start_codon:yes stop_codon:yes gene_type:complete
MQESWTYLLLVALGFLAGFLNTVAGGGTLLTLPILIFMGLPAPLAQGTNRVAILLQTFTAVRGFKSKGVSTYPFSLYVGIAALLGSIIGAYLALDFDGKAFNRMLAVVMIMVLFLTVFNPNKNLINTTEKLTGKPLVISLIVFFFLGIYGGLINAGIGFLMLIALPYINGMNLLRSNATKVFVVFIYTIGATIVFAFNDKIDYGLAAVLSIGNVSGAWFGSRWSVKKDEKVIKMLLVITVTALAIKLWFFD